MEITKSSAMLLFRFESVKRISMHKLGRRYDVEILFSGDKRITANGTTMEDAFEAAKEAIRKESI